MTYTANGNVTLNSRVLYISGGNGMTLNGSGNWTIGTDLVNTGTGGNLLALGGSGNSSFSGKLTDGSGALSVDVSGNWTLSGANTYTGQTGTASGTAALTITSIANYGSACAIGYGTPGTPIYLGSGANGEGTLIYTGGGNSSDRQFQISSYQGVQGGTVGGKILNNGTGALTFTAGTFIAPTPAAGQARYITLGGSYTASANEIQGVIQNSNGTAAPLSVTVSGGIWQLSGANTYTGTTTISGGILQLGNGGATGGLAGTASIANNANLTINRNNAFTQATDLNGKAITGTGSFTQAGTGTTTLSAANTYAGTTTVTAGTLQFANMPSLYNGNTLNWTAAKINVKSGATLALNVDSAGTSGFTAANLNTLLTNISVAGSASAGLQSGAKLGFDTSTATGASFTQGNAIANSTGANGGAIGVTKLGTGTLVFDKTNTYTGATAVQAGTLQVTGSIATTNANGGATVSGTPATSKLDLAGTGPVTPVDLNVGNAGTLLISTAGQQLGAISGTGTTEIAAGVGASLTANSIVQDTLIIGAGGSVTIRETPVAAGGAAGANANAVPEPGTWVLIGIGLLSLLAFRRRRAK
jgi:autotransporter-associated beta strand protein